jgi:carboxymethylenebutenolidase
MTPKAQSVTFTGAKHSFFNDQRPSYDPAASEDSWNRVLTFFKEHIE